MHVVIIGNGIAGCSLATALAENSNFIITLVSEESPYPFARTSLMYLYMGSVRMDDVLIHPREFWKSERIQRIHDKVTQIQPAERQIVLQHQDVVAYDVLVIATGSQVHRPTWWKEDYQEVTGLYHLHDLHNIEHLTSKPPHTAAIAGGGLIGIELSEMLLSRGITPVMIVRESAYMRHLLPQEEAQMVTQHILNQGVKLILGDEIEELVGEEGLLQHIRLKNQGLISCDFLGVTTGVSPDIQLAKEAGIMTQKGILVDGRLQTSIPDIYAIGDCAELQIAPPDRPATEAVWYTAKQMGIQLAEILTGQRQVYQPRIWHNSAAFFSLRMQQYGTILPNETNQIRNIFWQQNRNNRSIRIQYLPESGRVVGMLSLGSRLRNATCEQWLSDHTPIDQVVSSWEKASFEPEFSDDHHRLFKEFAIEALDRRKALTKP